MERTHEQGKLTSAFDSLAGGATRRLHRRPRAPFFVIALLALLTSGLFVAILFEDRQMQRDTLHRDIDSAALQIGARLSTLQETLTAVAREIGAGTMTEKKFTAIAQELLNAKREVQRIEYIGADGQERWLATPPTRLSKETEEAYAAEATPILARARTGRGVLFMPIGNGGREAPLAMAIPIFAEQQYVGAVLARVDLRALLIEGVAPETPERYRLAVMIGSRMLATTSASAPPVDALTHESALAPLPSEFRLHASAFRLHSRFTASALVWVVAGLAAAVLLALAALARFTMRQQRIDRALLAETSLRRAMENSLATGLRVIDTHGVIRYVNKSFCQMTGYAERELTGRSPPYPYWPPQHHAEYEKRLQTVLAGEVSGSGYEVEVRRKDGSVFDARMYVSPLVDDSGRHIGWMTSMADITESKRARNELAESHERFTTVLESLEAAVSVAVDRSNGQNAQELAFSNREYQSRFGADIEGHERLAALLKGADSAEVHDATIDRWFDVRKRDIRWVDGRPAHLQIATDITLRKVTDDIVRQQQEKVQFTSRLMTMGEMASSLAHELNQPLTAIANYSEGSLARVRSGQITAEELRAALEKTSAQAQRAGGIIRRIREFVKRSEPRRRPTSAAQVIDDAIGFAEIEAGKKGISIAATVDPTLGNLMVDPLMIEQVLLNLLKNAADAMEHATVRRIDVVVRRSLHDGMAEFAVIDRGSGIPEENLQSLFEPFFSTKSEGMGMGLNICRSIVEFHQGQLAVEKNPEPTGGTIMRFTLPLAPATGVEHNAAPLARSPHR